MKDSGIEWIDDIPSHWEVIKLKYLFRIVKLISGELGFDILSVTQSGVKIKDISQNEGQISMDYSKYQIVYPGQFVMNHMDLLTGFVDISKYDGVTSPDYRVFESYSEKVNNSYYLNIFQQCYRNRIFYRLGNGVSNLGRWRLSSQEFLDFVLPLPPISEQEHIVSYLDEKTSQIDKTIDIEKKKIELLKEYRQSLISSVVTGKIKVIE
jgi:type I restriction enzyme S subunit